MFNVLGQSWLFGNSSRIENVSFSRREFEFWKWWVIGWFDRTRIPHLGISFYEWQKLFQMFQVHFRTLFEGEKNSFADLNREISEAEAILSDQADQIDDRRNFFTL